MRASDRITVMYFLFFLQAIQFTDATAQGCSDAGLCTSPGLNTQMVSDTLSRRNYIRPGASIGLADNDIVVFNGSLSYGRKLSEKFSIATKINWQSNNSESLNIQSFSDIFLMFDYLYTEQLEFSLGFKAPLTDGNLKNNQQPLPMDYQPSLGTFDFLGGVTFKKERFGITLGIQQPLSQNNNQFVSEIYPEDDPLSGFQTTKDFKRSGDILLRAFYSIPIPKIKCIITPSILPIYHLTEDSYINENDQRIEIKGSKGLTLNGNAAIKFFLNSHSFELGYAAPFIVRDARPDGLTRSMVSYFEYSFWF